jgi:hypothetical protein
VLEGHPVGQEHAEQAVEAHGTIQSNIDKLVKEFRIYRWSPDYPNNKPYLESYFVDLSKCGPMVKFLLFFFFFFFFLNFKKTGFYIQDTVQNAFGSDKVYP